jgi:energy-coupling factor transporter ATP-binding protein EcfA2
MPHPVIEFKNFSFRYASQQEATLKDINLSVERGEKVLILGPSGSGKSTLAHCINGLIPFSFKGEITGSCQIAGVETSHASIFSLSKTVGTVLQDSDAQFVALSVEDDIAFALENQARTREDMQPLVAVAAQRVGMEGFLSHVPYQLSGGQKQKVALAGVMHEHVDILLFDEPLASLDPHSGQAAIELIDDLANDKTIVIIEHRLEDVMHRPIGRVIVMDEGRIVYDGSLNDLLKSSILRAVGIREPLYLEALRRFQPKHLNQPQVDSLDALKFERFSLPKISTQPKKPIDDVVIEFKAVHFAYAHNQVITDLSFKVHRGERLAFVGQNGAGKSTIAKLMSGIERPQHGTITHHGEDIRIYSIKELGERVAYVMQNPNHMLVKTFIHEEVALALELRHLDSAEMQKRIEEVLRVCGLWSMRNWPISALSYGQRKRVTVASILVLKPDILIVDEPTAGQDYKHYTDIMNFLNQLNATQAMAFIFITHDLHLAIEYTDRALVFANGRLLADDRIAQVLSDPELVEKAFLKQTSLYALAHRLQVDPAHVIDAFVAASGDA